MDSDLVFSIMSNIKVNFLTGTIFIHLIDFLDESFFHLFIIDIYFFLCKCGKLIDYGTGALRE